MRKAAIEKILKEASASLDGFSENIKKMYDLYEARSEKQKGVLDSFFSIIGILVGLMLPANFTLATSSISLNSFNYSLFILMEIYAYIFLIALGIMKAKGGKFDFDIINELQEEKDENKRITNMADYCKSKNIETIVLSIVFCVLLVIMLITLLSISSELRFV